MTSKTTGPRPSAVRESKDQGGPEDRLHVSALVFGLIDARACHVDFLDTPGGEELMRLFRRHHPGRRHGRN